MRILLKVLLFPVVIALSLLVAVGRFAYTFGGVLLSLGAVVFGLLGVATWFLENFMEALPAFVFAFILSPFGLTALAGLLVEGLDSVNDAIKSI